MSDILETQESEEDEPGTDEPEDEPTATVEKPQETPTPKQPATEMKVVIIMKADNIMLGVQSPDCDPVYKTMKGDLAAALQEVPGLVTEAKQKWGAAPRYPKANLPEPPPSTATARTPAAPAKPKAQPSFF